MTDVTYRKEHLENNITVLYGSDGSEEWRKNDLLHRDGGPAIIGKHCTFDIKIWCQSGVYHRDYGPAYDIGGDLYWYNYGIQHRIDGPSFEDHTGEAFTWHQYGLLHREYGPAWGSETSDKYDWYFQGSKWDSRRFWNYLLEISIALSPLKLSAYVFLWIFEFILTKNMDQLNRMKVIQMIQNISLLKGSKIDN